MLGELPAANGDADATRSASAGKAVSADTISTGAARLVTAATGAIGSDGFGSGWVSTAAARTPLACAAAPGPARAGASTSPASAVSTMAAAGSQTGHSRIVGAISRPHSGQIQWNMHLIYTQNRQLPVSHTPYWLESSNLRGAKIPTQGMCQAPPPLLRR